MADFISFLSIFLNGASALVDLIFSLPFIFVFPFFVLIFCFCIGFIAKLFRG